MGRQSWRFEGQPFESPHISVYNHPPVMAGLDPAITSLVGRSRASLSLTRDFAQASLRLLQLNLGASLFELGLDLLGFVLVDAFLDRLRRALDEVLGFLEAQAGDGADFLDDFDLLLAGGGEDDRELGLFFGGSSGGRGPTRTCDRRRGGHDPLFFR